MKTLALSFVRSFRADTIKLKNTPIFWISLLGGLFVTGLLFILHYFSVEEIHKPDTNPWIFYCAFGMTFISVLLVVPFAVLVTSSVMLPEHKTESDKDLYSLPLPKSQVYFSILVVVLGIIALTYLIFFSAHLLMGWILGLLRPEYEFYQYAPQTLHFAKILGHSYISVLGVAGLHYWLSVRWKNFIIPMGIGLCGYIISVMLSITQRFDLAIYFPYSYPAMIGNELGMENAAQLTWWGALTNVEWYSIGFLMLFAVVGFIEESRRNIK
jgi:hypothetical protein